MADILIMGWIDFAPGDREIWLAHADTLIEATLNEPGCFRHVVVADPHSPTAVITHAHYASQEAFREHVSSQHFLDFAAATDSCQAITHNVDRFEGKLVRASSVVHATGNAEQ